MRAGTACVSATRVGSAEYVATFKGAEFFCYDLSQSPIRSSADELTLAFRTRQRHGLLLHTGRSADYVNLSLKSGAVWLVINLGSGAFEALVEPVSGKFDDDAWHHVRVTRNLRVRDGPASPALLGGWPGRLGPFAGVSPRTPGPPPWVGVPDAWVPSPGG
uniref:Laminin G domain-containing protein n=1 Tax=Dromaius novaehollandiae TaxID=8790 RepID=A0A8C4JQR4_DRONO